MSRDRHQIGSANQAVTLAWANGSKIFRASGRQICSPTASSNGRVPRMQGTVLALMRACIESAVVSAAGRGGPFGALVAQGDRVVATGTNGVTLLCDPTAHAEIQAIRAACQQLGTFDLSGCDLYASCEPCPMC